MPIPIRKQACLALCVLAVLTTVPAQRTAGSAVAEEKRPAWAVPTFECLGLYFNSTSDQGSCRVQYQRADQQTWRDALPVTYDPLDKQYRGSLVRLTPDTGYLVRLQCGGQTVEFPARTRSEQFPVGKTTFLPAGAIDKPVRITEPGTAAGWHLVAPEPGKKATIDVFNLHDQCVEVAADYVIVRGLELKNGGQHAVLIRKGVKNVVVEDCHMTLWGRLAGARVWGVTSGSDSAVYAENGAGGLIIQRNLMDHPRSGANDWESGHPLGPQAVTLSNSAGGNVIRYNEIRSTEDHGFNDGFGGGSNNSFEGSPNRDSDIHGNIIMNCWDDAIESDGANMNVRIWGNYIDKTFVFVATAVTSKGPLYIYRNVFGESRVSHQDPSGGMIIKTGGSRRYLVVDGQKVNSDAGRRYIFHNTTLQPKGALDVFSSHGLCNAVSRNNIFCVRGNIYPSRAGDGPANDFQHDLTRGYLGGGFVRSMFVPSQRLEWFLSPTMNSIKWGRIEYTRSGKEFAITDPLVQVPNPAIDAGEILPGFNDDYRGKAPDLGAFENGGAPLRFGREAAPGFRPAPWETQSAE
jgi:hypothetical protein